MLDYTWDNWNEKNTPLYPHEKLIQFIFRNYSKHPFENKDIKIFDLGCGSGANTEFLATHGFETHALDISEEGIKNTIKRCQNKKLNITTQIGDVTNINYPSNFFDATISIGVFECIGKENLNQAINEAIRVTKNNGKIFLLFASNKDYRVGKHTGYSIYGASNKELEDILSESNKKYMTVHYDQYITTYENKKIIQNDHIITIQK